MRYLYRLLLLIIVPVALWLLGTVSVQAAGSGFHADTWVNKPSAGCTGFTVSIHDMSDASYEVDPSVIQYIRVDVFSRNWGAGDAGLTYIDTRFGGGVKFDSDVCGVSSNNLFLHVQVVPVNPDVPNRYHVMNFDAPMAPGSHAPNDRLNMNVELWSDTCNYNGGNIVSLTSPGLPPGNEGATPVFTTNIMPTRYFDAVSWRDCPGGTTRSFSTFYDLGVRRITGPDRDNFQYASPEVFSWGFRPAGYGPGERSRSWAPTQLFKPYTGFTDPRPYDGYYKWNITPGVILSSYPGVPMAGLDTSRFFRIFTDIRGNGATINGTTNPDGSFRSGQPMSFGGNIHNFSGSVAAQPSNSRITLTNLGTGATELDTGWVGTAALDPGQTITFASGGWTSHPGIYRVNVCANVSGNVYNMSGTNACSTTDFSVANLVASCASGSAGITLGAGTPQHDPRGSFGASVTGVRNVQKVYFQTYRTSYGSGAAMWFQASPTGGNWTASINLSQVNGVGYVLPGGQPDPDAGSVQINVQMLDLSGNFVLCGSKGFTVANPDMQISEFQLMNGSGVATTQFEAGEPIYTKVRTGNFGTDTMPTSSGLFYLGVWKNQFAAMAANPQFTSAGWPTINIGLRGSDNPPGSNWAYCSLPSLWGTCQHDPAWTSWTMPIAGSYSARAYVNFSSDAGHPADEYNQSNNQAGPIQYTVSYKKWFEVIPSDANLAMYQSDTKTPTLSYLTTVHNGTYDKWLTNGSQSIQTRITQICPVGGGACQTGGDGFGLSARLMVGNTSSLNISHAVEVGNPALKITTTNTPTPGKYRIVMVSTSGFSDPSKQPVTTIVTVTINFKPWLQVDVANRIGIPPLSRRVGTGDVFSQTSIDIKTPGIASMQRFFADNIGAVAIATAPYQVAIAPATTPSWIASTYAPSSSSPLNPSNFSTAMVDLENSLVQNKLLSAGQVSPNGKFNLDQNNVCSAAQPAVRLTSPTTSSITFTGSGLNKTGCSVFLIGDNSSTTNLIIGQNLDLTGTPTVFLVHGAVKVQADVNQMDGVYLMKSFDDAYNAPSVTQLVIHGALLAPEGDGLSSGSASGFKRRNADDYQPSEKIIFEPRYLDLIAPILGQHIYSWSEDD